MHWFYYIKHHIQFFHIYNFVLIIDCIINIKTKCTIVESFYFNKFYCKVSSAWRWMAPAHFAASESLSHILVQQLAAIPWVALQAGPCVCSKNLSHKNSLCGRDSSSIALLQLQQSSKIKRCWSLLDLRIPQNHFLCERFFSMALFQLQQSSRIKRCWSLLNLRIPFA